VSTNAWVNLTIGLTLFGTWTALVVFQVDGAHDLISAIQIALTGLGAYHINDRSNKP
jgi:hypothetical protein